jgi:Sensors of blue-light using FAD
MALFHLIYTSQPFGYDNLSLDSILASARINNRRDVITGALICREDLFVQMLEGEEDAVRATFARIQHDDRHANIELRVAETINGRQFPEWAMRHDPALSWMWSRADVSSGAVGKATADDIRHVFTRLASIPPSVTQTCPVQAQV